MTGSRQTTPRDRYRIVARWQFGALPTAAFDDVEIETIAGMTVLLAWVRDDQELHGLLDRMRDQGVDIESVSPTTRPSNFADREADLGGMRWQTR
jgi:hypothetical protein